MGTPRGFCKGPLIKNLYKISARITGRFGSKPPPTPPPNGNGGRSPRCSVAGYRGEAYFLAATTGTSFSANGTSTVIARVPQKVSSFGSPWSAVVGARRNV